MIRTARLRREPAISDGFRLRGREVTRLEGFSDAVFGFALTLLVVSLDVPKTFDDLMQTMRGFPAFALCFTLLVLIWNAHYKYCRRYGLEDTTARTLTFVLLFLVLFYVYPLKFLFNLSVNGLVLHEHGTATRMSYSQFSALMTIYGLGFAAVYGALACLYLHAYRLRDALELNELERLDTRFHLTRILAMAVIGIAGAILAHIRPIAAYSGFVYLAIFPILRTHRIVHRRRRAPLLESLDPPGTR